MSLKESRNNQRISQISEHLLINGYTVIIYYSDDGAETLLSSLQDILLNSFSQIDHSHNCENQDPL